MRTIRCVAAAVVSIAAISASVESAGAVALFVGLQQDALPLLTVASSSNLGFISANLTFGTNQIQASAFGFPVVPGATLLSNTVDVSTVSANQLQVFVSEVGLPAGDYGTYNMAFTTNFSNNVSSIEERVFLDPTNVPYGMATLAGAALFPAGAPNTSIATHTPMNFASEFSITHAYKIAFSGPGGFANLSINSFATPNTVPLPASFPLLGTALAAIFSLSWRRRPLVA